MKKIYQIDQTKAASLIEKDIVCALKICLKDVASHPIRLIQASKSLIGLDLDCPNQTLLNFSSNCVEKYKKASNYEIFDYQTDTNEVISVYDLEKAFLNKDKASILNMLDQLSRVSSELHILEYLIEISLKQSGSSFLLIWSLYKSIAFISNKDSKLFIRFASDIILSDKFEDYIEQDEQWSFKIIKSNSLSMDSIDLYAHLLEAYNSNLVRSFKIKNLIIGLVNRKLNLGSKQFSSNQTIKFIDLLDKDRFWLIDFINKIDKQKITNDMILFLDSIRCLFKFSDKSYYKFICFQFDKFLKDVDV